MKKTKSNVLNLDKTTKTVLIILTIIILLCILTVTLFYSKEILWTANFLTHQEDFNTTFSNELFSFKYPSNWEREKEYSIPFVMIEEEYKDYYDIYFLGTKDWDKMIIAMGSDANVNQDLNTLGEVLTLIATSSDNLVEQNGIIKSNNREFYQMIHHVTIDDEKSLRTKLLTFCQNKLIEIVIFSSERETRTIDLIKTSFECK